MPTLKYKLPSYFLHKATGQAVAKIRGRAQYLGKCGSPEGHAAYHALMAEFTAVGPSSAARHAGTAESLADLRVNELLVAYLEFARGYYVKHGHPTGEFANMKHAAKPLLTLYEALPVCQFGPTCLRAIRDRMIQSDLSRKVVNARINRVRRIFKWGVERRFVAPGVLQALQSVAPLKQGRSEARETSRVTPVSQAHVDAVTARVTRPVKAMIQLQLATGMRPGEVVLMRTCDIDMSGKIWEYRPGLHKTEHHGIDRIIFLGPRVATALHSFGLGRFG